MFRTLLMSIALLCRLQAQGDSFPLESVSVEGTALSKDVVLELAGLRLGAPIDQAAMQTASQKLNDSGMFESVNYSYASGAKHGYALTLKLADPHALFKATIDIPGVNEDETGNGWRRAIPRSITKCRPTMPRSNSLLESWKSILAPRSKATI
jgi:hypothetical protein